MEVAERIRAQSRELTSAERRVAEAILASPQAVGFGTVADLAAAARVGAASVVRLAAKLGFDGFSSLQESVQRDLVQQLRPAAERIHEGASSGRSRHTTVELSNVQATLEAVDEAALDALVARLADLDRPVRVVSGDATAGVASQFVSQLHQLRADVQLIGGSDVVVHREVAILACNATVLVIDLRRYERWVLDTHAVLAERGVWTAGFTDSMLSPIASRAAATFLVTAGSEGPFDSHVGTLALLNLVGSRVAAEVRVPAADRLASIESAWRAQRTLTDGD